ncbi:RNA polymerase II elongation factor ELL3 [Pelodytes ibericus]
MSRAGEELCGTLSYRTEPRRNPRLSLYHLKLTDSALRCLKDFQKRQVSGISLAQPVITFQGNQGYIKIPSPISGCDDRVRVFAFYLSRESKDKPQSSFECIRQGTSWSGEKQLSCVGSIQDKITVCATDESYQLTRDRMSQVEKETWSRTAIEIKPGASYRTKCVKIPNKTMDLNKEDSSCSRPPSVFLTPAAKKCKRVNGDHRPLQEWLIHLLALKPHRKQDLLLRLQRANALPREHAEPLSMLDMVGRLSPKDGSYSLREELYSQVQKDWIGYTPEEKQYVTDLLSRKQANISSSRNCPATDPDAPRMQQGPTSSHPSARVRPPEAKRPAPPGIPGGENCKRIRGPHLISRGKGEKYSSSPNANSRHHTNTGDVKSQFSVSENHSDYQLQNHKKQDIHSSLFKNQQSETHRRSKPHNVPRTDKTRHQGATSQVSQMHKRKKGEQNSSDEEEEDDDWEEQALLLEKCLCYPEEKQQFLETTSLSEEDPDYFKKYCTITSQDQRKMYEEDFASDYNEYLELHAKIGKVLERFVYLGSKMKRVQAGTVEHKMIENKILTEYKKFKKTYPGYREEKSRCEYLHHKLSHIKNMILEFEKSMPT